MEDQTPRKGALNSNLGSHVADLITQLTQNLRKTIDGMTSTTANLIGTTPWVQQGPNGPIDDPTWARDPDLAWVTPGYSHRMFTWYLTAGTHYFAIRAAASPWGSGSAYIKFCPSNYAVGGNLLPQSNSVISVAALFGAIGAIAVVVGSRKKRAL